MEKPLKILLQNFYFMIFEQGTGGTVQKNESVLFSSQVSCRRKTTFFSLNGLRQVELMATFHAEARDAGRRRHYGPSSILHLLP
jgi:hypothetical protein